MKQIVILALFCLLAATVSARTFELQVEEPREGDLPEESDYNGSLDADEFGSDEGPQARFFFDQIQRFFEQIFNKRSTTTAAPAQATEAATEATTEATTIKP